LAQVLPGVDAEVLRDLPQIARAGEEFVALYLWLHSNYSFGAQAEHARKTMGGCGFGVLPQATRRDAANGANAGGERNQLTVA